MEQPPTDSEQQDTNYQSYDPYQNWIQVLKDDRGQSFYGDQNWKDDTIHPTMRLPTPPPQIKSPKKAFRSWSTSTKVAIGTLSFFILALTLALFVILAPDKSGTSTTGSNINTQVPGPTQTFVISPIPTKASHTKAIQTLTPTNTSSPTKFQPTPLTTPLPTEQPTSTPVPLPTSTPLPTPTLLPTTPPLPTPTPLPTPKDGVP